MTQRTTAWLEAAFSLALVACREKAAAVAPPTPLSPSAVPRSLAIANTEPTTTVSERPDELRPGQACAGSLVPALHPGVPVDYLELRLDYYPERAHEIVIAGHAGTPCATAKDRAACAKALAAAHSTESGEYLVYTRGDEVGTVAGHAAGGFLAPIDSPEEAALAVVYDYRAGKSAAEVYPPCEAANFTETKTGFQTVYRQIMLCEERRDLTLSVSREGQVSSSNPIYTPPRLDCQRPFLGRKPEGFSLAAPDAQITLGSYFSDCATMEAASIFAFRRLERELHALRAPRALQARAARAARDEARHAKLMRRLALRFAAAPPSFRIEPPARRALVAMAVENAIEGCVRETWAALVAAFQAERACDPAIRATLRSIARDETQHAALAWDVAAWLETRLGAEERVRVERARTAALEELSSQFVCEPSPELRELAGVPSTTQALALFAAWRGLFRSRRAA